MNTLQFCEAILCPGKLIKSKVVPEELAVTN